MISEGTEILKYLEFGDKKRRKTTVPGIPAWSPTAVLTWRCYAWMWLSGREASFSELYDCSCYSFTAYDFIGCILYHEFERSKSIEELPTRVTAALTVPRLNTKGPFVCCSEFGGESITETVMITSTAFIKNKMIAVKVDWPEVATRI